MPAISKRSGDVPLSPFRKLVPYSDQAKAKGKKVYHLNIGQPDIPTPPAAIKALQETQLDILAYSPAVGNLSYRKKLCEYYRRFEVEVDPEEIIITTGASEGIQMLFYACLDRGDELIIPEPFYANYNGFAQIADVHIQPIPTYIEDGFKLPTLAEFEARINDKTRGIFITNPSNPTGSFFDQNDLMKLAALVQANDIYLFVDEVYREFCYDDNEFFSCLRLAGLEENVVVIDSVSKRYSACGARVGAIVTRNRTVLDSLTRYAKLRLSPPGLGQILAEAIIDRDGNYLQEVKAEYDQRRQVVFRRLQGMPGVLSYRPGGAFYCFARFPVDDASKFCQWLLQDFDLDGATVMLSPGQGFYATPGRGRNEVRIAYILNVKDLEAAMDCLEEALRVYPGIVSTSNSAVHYTP
jgi:aspartate aminotransferase